MKWPGLRSSDGREGTTLFWQVFLPNAIVLAVAVAVLAFTPASVSSQFEAAQAVALLCALIATVLVNLVLIRRAVAPLEQLTRVMAAIDPLHPGQRVQVDRSVSETAELADVFNAMIDRLETERRESGRRMLSVQEEERVRLARELHDEIGQSITGLMLEVDHAARQAPEDVARELRDVQEAARGLSEEIRTIVRRLRPEALDELGLQSSLVALSQRMGQQARLHVRRRLGPALPELDSDVALVIYRVAQESLTNVVRHADATEVELALEPSDEGVRLRVTDDGKGIGASRPGNGMQGMLERALLVGARVEFLAAPAGGTEVRLDVPLARAN
jgi:two-component system, NarL family, sensor histidine kinase UhpB